MEELDTPNQTSSEVVKSLLILREGQYYTIFCDLFY